MSQIEVFNNEEFGSIRVIEENGKYICSAAWMPQKHWGTKTQ